jgi:hypothetical protein
LLKINKIFIRRIVSNKIKGMGPKTGLQGLLGKTMMNHTMNKEQLDVL